MRLLSTDDAFFETISNFDSVGARAQPLADGTGEAHVYLLHFDAGGAIGRHEAGYGQLFGIMTGAGWVSGDDGGRIAVGAGDVVHFERESSCSRSAGPYRRIHE